MMIALILLECSSKPMFDCECISIAVSALAARSLLSAELVELVSVSAL